MISLADLQFMEALARAGSLSGAARSLNVTPPALSLRFTRIPNFKPPNPQNALWARPGIGKVGCSTPGACAKRAARKSCQHIEQQI